VIWYVSFSDCTGEDVSVSVTPKEKDPAVVGVPLIAPVEFSVRPAGRPLVATQMYGAVPPVAVSLVLYELPTIAPGSVVEPVPRGVRLAETTVS
jgi:hypothetical protein